LLLFFIIANCYADALLRISGVVKVYFANVRAQGTRQTIERWRKYRPNVFVYRRSMLAEIIKAVSLKTDNNHNFILAEPGALIRRVVLLEILQIVA